MSDENVVQLPTQLERLAVQIKKDLEDIANGTLTWREGAYQLCLDLTEAKRKYPALIEFGHWCEASGFGKEVLSHQDRAAALAMGQEPDALRQCLDATTRHSLREIYQHEYSRFTSAGKTKPKRPPKAKKNPPTESEPAEPKELGPIAESLRQAVREEVEREGRVNRRQMAEAHDVGQTTVAYVEQREIGRLEGWKERGEALIIPLSPEEMNPSMRKRYDAAVRIAVNAVREKIKAEIHATYDIYIDQMKERTERANRIIESHKGVMSHADFRRVKAALHPDHNKSSFASEVLQMFSELEDVIVKPEVPVTSGPPLPGSVAELLARRKTKR